MGLGKVLTGGNSALITTIRSFFICRVCGEWVGLRLDVGRVNWGDVEELAKGSYQLITGKTVALS
jgi:hypothetical protein